MGLFHFTCNHGQTDIVNEGFRVRPPSTRMLPAVMDQAEWSLGKMAWTLYVTWWTDEALPSAEALGFAVGNVDCDRMEHRFQATDETRIQSWREFRNSAPRDVAAGMEGVPLAEPGIWFVSIAPAVPVKYVPITDDERAGSRLWTP